MKFSISHVGISAYVMPAALSVFIAPMYGYEMSVEGIAVITTSIFAAVAGYATSTLLRKNSSPVSDDIESIKFELKIDRQIAFLFMACGLAALTANFISVRTIPLLSSGTGRIAMMQSPLWNVFILCSLGVFVYSRTIRRKKPDFPAVILISGYILGAALTAWKGALLLVLMLIIAPLCKRVPVTFFKTMGFIFLFYILFLAVNFLRGDLSFRSVFEQPLFYAIWGFVNFDREATNFVGECIYTLPMSGCQFSIENSLLINPTWNVFTALSPIYIDGGVAFVFLFFFSSAFILRFSETSKSNICIDYVYFLSLYFFIMAHNGYVYYSNSFLVSLIFLCSLFMLKRSTIYALKRR